MDMRTIGRVLDDAQQRRILLSTQRDELWALFEEQRQQRGLTFWNVAIFFFGVLAIAGVTVGTTVGLEKLTGWQIAGAATACFLLGVFLAERFRQDKVNAGTSVMSAFAVATVPMIVFGLQLEYGLWCIEGLTHKFGEECPVKSRHFYFYVNERWMMMEIASLIVGTLLYLRYRLPFTAMPIAIVLWFMSMDLTPFILQYIGAIPDGIDLNAGYADYIHYWDLRLMVALWFGVATILVALLIEKATPNREHDHMFWIYVAGVFSFWGGMSLMRPGDDIDRFVYGLICTGMIIIGTGVLKRQVFSWFGGIGLFGLLLYYASEVFKDEPLFGFAVAAVGVIGVVCVIIIMRIQQRSRAQSVPA